MNTQISQEQYDRITSTVWIMFLFLMCVTCVIGVMLSLWAEIHKILFTNKGTSYDLVSSLMDKAISAKTDPRILKILAGAIAVHFKEIGVTNQDIKLDSLIHEVLNQNYSNLLYGVKDPKIPSKTFNSLMFALPMVFMLVGLIALVVTSVIVFRNSQNTEKNRLKKKRAGIFFIPLSAISAIAGGVLIYFTAAKGLTLDFNDMNGLVNKFNQILPDTINAFHVHSGMIAPDGMQNVIVHHLDLSIQTYNQLGLSAGFFEAITGCFLLSIAFALSSLFLFLASRREANNSEISPDETPHYDAPPDYNDTNYTSHDPNAQTDTVTQNFNLPPPPYQALPTINVGGESVSFTTQDSQPTDLPPRYQLFDPRGNNPHSSRPNSLPPPPPYQPPAYTPNPDNQIPVVDSTQQDVSQPREQNVSQPQISQQSAEAYNPFTAERVTHLRVNEAIASLIPVISSRLSNVTTQFVRDYWQWNSMHRRSTEISYSFD